MDSQPRQAIVSRRRSFWIPVVAFVVLIVIGLVVLRVNRDLPFDSTLWKTEENLRPRMVRDLLDQYRFVGMSRENVDTMLGQPEGRDSVRNGTYIYWAGTDGVLDDMWLEIDFENDVAIASRYVPD